MYWNLYNKNLTSTLLYNYLGKGRSFFHKVLGGQAESEDLEYL